MRSNYKASALLAALAVLTLAGCGRQPAESPVALTGSRIVELEAQFAAASRERGARAAFLEFLAEDSIVLQPGPVWGRAAWEATRAVPGTLDWAPDRAQISTDGRFGYATGRWTLTGEDDAAAAEGRYVTVWREDAAGWRVVFDGGFGRAPTGAVASAGMAELDATRCQGDPSAAPADLQSLDLGLSAAEGGGTFGERLKRLAAPELVLFHAPNAEGEQGAEAFAAALAAVPPTVQLLPMGAGMAASGDLGYTYGLSASAAETSADTAYLHVWCRQAGDWLLLLELRAKLPPQALEDPAS